MIENSRNHRHGGNKPKRRFQTRVFTANTNLSGSGAVERPNRSRPFSPYAPNPHRTERHGTNPHSGNRGTNHHSSGPRKMGHFKRSPRISSHRSAPMPKEGFRTVGNLRKKPVDENGVEKIILEAPDINTVRIIPLGGVEEVGRNMCVVELSNDIFVLDCGFQFVTETDSPGIDYILPNIEYLEQRKGRIKGVIITHGHLDHIGGIPYIMERIGNPPIYTRYLTSLMIKKRNIEFPHLPESDIKIVEPGDRIKIGETSVEFFPVTHSIPDAMGVIIDTKHGNVIFTGDLKLDQKEGVVAKDEEERWNKISKMNNLFFAADSTNTERPGFSISEKQVHQTLEDIVKNTKGRLIIGTFASQFERMIKIIEVSDNNNKKIITEGRSIKTNIEIAKEAGILKIKENTIIGAEDIEKYPPDRIVILATGAQGEEFAALMRISTKKHKYITLNDRDTIVLSSSVIPGNEISVQKLKDNLYRHNIKLIHYRVSDVHSTGHGNAGELVWINQKVNAKFFMPAYGFRSMLANHAQAVIAAGFPKERVVIPDNGNIIEIKNGEELIVRKEKAASNPLMVDGFSIGDMQEVVIRDRQTLSKDGMFVIIASINSRTGKLRKSPDIISRGFVYLRESQELLNQARLIIKKTVEDTTVGMNPINLEYTKGAIADNVSRFLFQKTNKRPIVIPVLIGV
ncbi:MAG: ribonuclease J [Patescibacteria group bacterium]